LRERRPRWLAVWGCAIDGQRKERGIGEEGKWREAVLTGGTRGVVRAKRVRRCGRGVADVRASCAARERGAERRALKAERTGVRGWAAALKVEQAGAEQQLAGRVGGLPSRSGRAALSGPGRQRAERSRPEGGKGRGVLGRPVPRLGQNRKKGYFPI